MKALVLGGYGLIGSACLRALKREGFAVAGLGRSRTAAQACDPACDWVIRDMPSISVEDWHALLEDVDVVVNAAGALQDGPRDNLTAIHEQAIAPLVMAARGRPLRLIQISATGVSPRASTRFFRSKSRGDAQVMQADDWVILRPTLVLSPDAYGGTALLRAVAAMPALLPRIMPDAMVQTVHVEDVANAVVAAALGRIPPKTVADLTEPHARSFPELTGSIRRWMGVPPPIWAPALPGALLTLGARCADALGWLGWRSPLRSTALRALQDGIRGDPGPWLRAGGAPCRSLSQTLQDLPATRQDRLFARAYLAVPCAIGLLFLFWLASGLIALIDIPAATAILTERGTSTQAARAMVIGGACADIALGLAILIRRFVRPAAVGMILLSLGYLAGSLALAPDLWTDPLGAMVKVLPGIGLAGLVWLLVDVR